MSKVAVFPGSFDPITIGHVDIVERSLPLFDKVIVAIGENSQKKTLLTLKQRLEHINTVFKKHEKVEVSSYHGLTVNFCREHKANYIIRGIRSSSDFEYEKTIAHLNYAMEPGLETVLILARAELSSISSTIVREIIRGKGNVEKFIPAELINEFPHR
ncbi:MAG: pantetheine-phosphate adenylyltransferase [Bacteroidia bacterium]|nr:pantetheine-phosphate adenylyltransferase [Bacteroidia bacterium]